MILAERAARLKAEARSGEANAAAPRPSADGVQQRSADRAISSWRSRSCGESSMGRARSARRGCSIRWSCNSRSWRRQRPRTSWRPRTRRRRTQTVKSFERKRPARKPFPEHLPRERVVIAAPESCPCCGSAKLSKLGEDITETLEVIPRQWKVIQTVREKFSCRRLRDDHAAAGALPCHAARLCRAEPAGHDPVREVRPASAAEPPERALCPARASI